ncbi:MAG: gliding motility-associated C-terminal domain-containing protein [Flavobacterium sp.]
MKQKYKYIVSLCITLISVFSFAQNVSLYEQFNGRYSFTFIGNTLNVMENNIQAELDILSESSATLNLAPEDEVVAAYLYWAGSGTGDFEIKLNDQNITATRDFALTQVSVGNEFDYFSAFADITTYVQNTGNGTYTFSELDIQEALETNFIVRTNFAGWAIIVVYENQSFPINQLNVYDGLQGVPQNLSIVLDNLNVIDNIGSQIGFLAWEGDSTLAITETLKLNGSVIGNPPLNPNNNAFNSTNSFTGQTNLFNMDLDVYPVQNYIDIGDTSALIELTSGQDFVMINAVVSKFNSQLPDATIVIDNFETDCGSREVILNYTVSNNTSSDVLPAGTLIHFIVNGVVVGQSLTTQDLEIDASESGTITLSIPLNLGNELDIVAQIDPNNAVIELEEDNNFFNLTENLVLNPTLLTFETIEICGFCDTSFTFDLSTVIATLENNGLPYSFYLNENDAENEQNAITITNNFITENANTILYIRIENESCYTVATLFLKVITCPFDATADFLNYNFVCDSQVINVTFEVFNALCLEAIPAGTPYSFYIGDDLLNINFIPEAVPSGESIVLTDVLVIPESAGNVFTITLVINDYGTGNPENEEFDFTNNTTEINIVLYESPNALPLPTVETCQNCATSFDFDLTSTLEILNNNGFPFSFHESVADAENDLNPLPLTNIFTTINTQNTLYIRIENSFCFIVEPLQLNTILCEPDASIDALNYEYVCSSRDIVVNYQLFNSICGVEFPVQAPLAFFINGTLIGTSTTQNIVPTDGNVNESVAISIPESFGNSFTLTIILNDDGTGNHPIAETNYDNNNTTIDITLYENPLPIPLPDLTSCNVGNLKAVFDFSENVALLQAQNYEDFSFHSSFSDAEANENEINFTATFEAPTTPFQIFVRIENERCFTIFEFNLLSKRCPPIVYNYISENNNGYNDVFYIEGLLDIFTEFNLTIFNKWGHKIWSGKNEDGFWDGTAKFGTLNLGNKVPDGTYFYILELNDEAYPEPLTGYLYLNH